jgi:hypothetical protein
MSPHIEFQQKTSRRGIHERIHWKVRDFVEIGLSYEWIGWISGPTIFNKIFHHEFQHHLWNWVRKHGKFIDGNMQTMPYYLGFKVISAVVMKSSGLRRRVARSKSTDVSEEHIAEPTCYLILSGFLLGLFFDILSPSLALSLSTRLHWATYQNTIIFILGRAIAQAVSYRLPTAGSGFDPRLVHVGFVVDEVALGQVCSEYFGFPCQFSFHRLLHTHNLLSGAGIIGQILADVPSGLSVTPP